MPTGVVSGNTVDQQSQKRNNCNYRFNNIKSSGEKKGIYKLLQCFVIINHGTSLVNDDEV